MEDANNGLIFKSVEKNPEDFSPRSTSVAILNKIQQMTNYIYGVDSAVFAIFTNEAFSSEAENAVKAWPIRFAKDGTVSLDKPQDISLAQKGMIARSRTLKWIQEVNPGLIIANNFAVIDQYTKKSKQAELLKGHYIPTLLIPPGTELADKIFDEFFHAFGNADVVIKPETGSKSKLVFKVSKNFTAIQETILAIQEARKGKEPVNLLLQPYMPPEPFPSLKGSTPEEHKRLLGINRACELRAFVTLGPLNKFCPHLSTVHVFGREINPFGDDKVDEWISLNQSSIPDSVITLAHNSARNLMNVTESKGIFVAVDIIRHDGKDYIMELNVQDPTILNPKEYPRDAARLVSNFASIFLG